MPGVRAFLKEKGNADSYANLEGKSHSHSSYASDSSSVQ
jgi:hypothetical protein